MSGFFVRIADFFDRHRAHCVNHQSYRRDCEACLLTNQTANVDQAANVETFPTTWIDTSPNYYSADTTADTSCSCNSSLDTSFPDNSSPDTSSSGSSFSDSSSSGSSDFGGFGGGESGGGGASGDF
jgi:uncharacterized membrane protein YgcG